MVVLDESLKFNDIKFKGDNAGGGLGWGEYHVLHVPAQAKPKPVIYWAENRT